MASSAAVRVFFYESLPPIKQRSAGATNQTGALMSHPSRQVISSWSGSSAKRVFDIGCVLLALPATIPLALATAAAVFITSPGPVLFLQKRVGRHGRTFTIFKFRTLIHRSEATHPPITALDNQQFTSIGPFLRRWKLDELPQLANVLLGHMSLVGPRPKIPEHTIFDLPCRPGLTGKATVAFAEEETMLSVVPAGQRDAYFYNVVLPAKQRLDAEYTARATFLSDVRLLTRSVLRRWDVTAGDVFIVREHLEWELRSLSSELFAPTAQRS